MSFTKDSAAQRAKQDLSERLGLDTGDLKELGVTDRDFPDMSLGSPVADEMAAQMISSGWVIRLGAADDVYEYRADKYQIRLHNFNGTNYVIES